jgi:hypothetical protein
MWASLLSRQELLSFASPVKAFIPASNSCSGVALRGGRCASTTMRAQHGETSARSSFRIWILRPQMQTPSNNQRTALEKTKKVTDCLGAAIWLRTATTKTTNETPTIIEFKAIASACLARVTLGRQNHIATERILLLRRL